MSVAPPRVVVDCRMLHDGGVGTYLRGLLPRLIAKHPEWRFTLLGRLEAMRKQAFSQGSNVELRQCVSRIFSVREQAELPTLTPADTALYWSPLYNIPLAVQARMFVTVHDLCHIALWRTMGGPLRRLYAEAFFRAVRRRADAIAFDSEFTRSEFEQYVGRSAAIQRVIHAGVDDAWHAVATMKRSDTPYVLYVGNVKRHKNVGLLIRAFARIAADVPHRLLIVGRREGLTTDSAVERAAAALGDRVVLTGEVPDDVLRRYVRDADVLVNPSLYEGFGLPPLEAMAAGCPVIVARTSAFPEVCGDAALYCDPHDDTDLANRLREVLGQPGLRADLIARGKSRAARFTWERCASETGALLADVLAQSGYGRDNGVTTSRSEVLRTS